MISAEQERNIGDVILIETYWNVNFTNCRGYGQREKILIETYWNVNTPYSKKQLFRIYILIETYWNVNAVTERVLDRYGSNINRDILECK